MRWQNTFWLPRVNNLLVPELRCLSEITHRSVFILGFELEFCILPVKHQQLSFDRLPSSYGICSIRTADLKILNILIQAGSVLGTTDKNSGMTMQRRILQEVKNIMDNPEHPLHETV